jgi:hypothetical protein
LVLPPVPEASPDPRLQPKPADPARLNLPKLREAAVRIASLNEEAAKFRQQGEFKLAQAALKEAEQLDPKNSTTLASLALLAEAKNDWPAARAYWQRLADLGPESGSSYRLAKERLLVFDHQGEGPQPPAQSPTLAKRLFISGIEAPPVKSGKDGQQFKLRVTIAAAAAEKKIEPGAVRVKLYFYDQMENGDILPTAAKLKVAFEGDQNWLTEQKEVLSAEYLLSPGARRYYGYVLRIYYQGELQDEKAEPAILLNLFPTRVAGG